MGIPQIIMIVLMSMSVGMSLVKHGESRGNYSFWSTLIAAVIEVVILKCGGFF